MGVQASIFWSTPVQLKHPPSWTLSVLPLAFSFNMYDRLYLLSCSEIRHFLCVLSVTLSVLSALFLLPSAPPPIYVGPLSIYVATPLAGHHDAALPFVVLV